MPGDGGGDGACFPVAEAPGPGPVTGPARTGGPVTATVHASDPITAAGVSGQLRQDPSIRIVTQAQQGPGSVAVVAAETIDSAVILLLRRLVRGAGARAVLVTEAVREAELLDVVECGVAAIVWRHAATAQRLHQAVHTAHKGEGDMPPDLLARLLDQVAQLQRRAADEDRPLAGLSARESDVLRLVADGLDTREIAGKLAYSERTVKNVLHGMTTRLNLRNRAHAVAYALREGYI
ncbi:helix-turn-helix transcriptional regulator [Streptomyces albicerus]|uniref:helix-turn-helix transcriptional regulator n=1 Tax=Streptomyces albicerus TaxID=2569859 RepID=UPI00124B43A8